MCFLRGPQIDHHVVEDVFNIVGYLCNVSLSLFHLLLVRSLFKGFPSGFFVREPGLDNLRVIAVADHGITDIVHDLLQLIIEIIFRIRLICIFIDVVTSLLEGTGRHAERIKVEILVFDHLLTVSIVGQEVLNLGVDLAQALAIDKSVLSDESNVLLVRLHADLDVLVADLLSPVNESVPGRFNCIHVGLPGADPLLVLELRLGLL